MSDFLLGTDELGEYARVSVDPALYSQVAILKTAYWFTDRCYLYLEIRSPYIEIEFRFKQETNQENLRDLCGLFLNNLLDQAVRQQVLEETSSIRDTLVKKAFFDAKESLKERVKSDESYLPNENHSFKDDPLNISGQ